MVTHYLKIAWRNLWKYKLQTAVGISGLAACLLGFGLCLYVCRTMWAIDHCFPNRERIAEIALTSEAFRGDVSGIPTETISLLRAMNCRGAEAFTYVAFPLDRSFQVETEQGTMLPFDPMLCLEADTCFRHVFGADILAGSWQRATQTPNAVVLSATTARRIFGENVANAVGKRLVTTAKLPYSDRRGGVAYAVQAVMADIPVNNSVSYMQHIDMLVLNDSDGRLQHTQEGLTGGTGYVLLREDNGWQALTDDIRAKGLVQHLFGQNLDIELRPLGYAYREYGSSTKYAVWVAFTIGTLVLLAGLLNFFYFQIVTFLHRSREYSLRQVFGGRATDLLWQLFTQAALTVVLAFLLLFALLELGAPLLQDSLKSIVLVEMAQLRMQCAEYLGLVLACSFGVCGLTVWHVRRHEIQTGIRGSAVGHGKHRVRNLVLSVQYFICWLFLTLTVALYLQADKTTSELLGTLSPKEKSRILSISLDYPFLQQAEKLSLAKRMKQHAGVEDCLLADVAYTRGWSGNVLFTTPASHPNCQWVEGNIYGVGRNFFDFMRVPLVQGRLPEDGNWMVTDRDFAREIKEKTGKEAMGQVLYDYVKGYPVAAVCAPFTTNAYSMGGGREKCAFVSADFRDYVAHCYLKCHEGQTDEVRAYAEDVLRQALPHTVELRMSTLQDEIEEAQWVENMMKDIVLFLAAVCLAITLMGVYAAITLDTRQRRKEVAIRKINGAGVKQIIWLFARTYLWIGGLTAAAAFPLLYGFMDWWSGMYNTFFHYGPRFWLGILLAVMAVTALTVVHHIVRIARLNPADVVKEMN